MVFTSSVPKMVDAMTNVTYCRKDEETGSHRGVTEKEDVRSPI